MKVGAKKNHTKWKCVQTNDSKWKGVLTNDFKWKCVQINILNESVYK